MRRLWNANDLAHALVFNLFCLIISRFYLFNYLFYCLIYSIYIYFIICLYELFYLAILLFIRLDVIRTTIRTAGSLRLIISLPLCIQFITLAVNFLIPRFSAERALLCWRWSSYRWIYKY